LLSEGADVNILNKQGRTPLFYCNTFTKLLIFLDAGVNVDVKDTSGRYAHEYLPERFQKELYDRHGAPVGMNKVGTMHQRAFASQILTLLL
jgi:hypothetical protein